MGVCESSFPEMVGSGAARSGPLLLGSFGDIIQNYSNAASADPRRGGQIFSDGKLHFFEVFFQL